MAEEKVLMEHPNVKHTKDQPVLISKSSFEAVWKERGWKIHRPKKEKT